MAELTSGDAPGVRIDCVEVSARVSGTQDAAPQAELVGSGKSSLRRFRRSDRSGVEPRVLMKSLERQVNLAVAAPDVDSALAVVKDARRAGMLEHLWVTSTDLGVLEVVRSDSPATRLLHVCDPVKEPRGAERHAATLREARIEGVMVRHDIAGSGLVALMHRFGCILGAHGAEYPRMVRSCLAAGADLVCSPSARAFEDL